MINKTFCTVYIDLSYCLSQTKFGYDKEMPVVRHFVRSPVRPTCERNIFRTFSPIDFKYIIPPKYYGPSAKHKMTAVELFKMYTMDTTCERVTFKIVSPIDCRFDL